MVLTDQFLRRGRDIDHLLYDKTYANWSGVAAFVIGLGVSVLLFSNQHKFVGVIPRQLPELGDITFFVGFVLSAAIYWAVNRSRISRQAVAA